MRKRLCGWVAAAVCGTAGWCVAQDLDLFDRLDANKDGVITKEEVGEKAAQFERMLAKADKNSDGKLSREEFAAGLKDPELKPAPGGEGGRPDPKQMFQRADRNGNGKIEKEEAPDRLKENFDRLDTNSDGAIDEKEFGRVIEMMTGRRPDGGEKRPEGRPESRPEGRPETRPEGRPEGPPLVRALDTNGDGEISAEEIAGAAESLKKLDKNGDGKLTREELMPPGGERPGLFGGGAFNPGEFAARLKEADKNGDGKISRDEAPERLRPLFDRADANSDGQIDEAELRTMFQKLREQLGGRPQNGDRPQRPE